MRRLVPALLFVRPDWTCVRPRPPGRIGRIVGPWAGSGAFCTPGNGTRANGKHPPSANLGWWLFRMVCEPRTRVFILNMFHRDCALSGLTTAAILRAMNPSAAGYCEMEGAWTWSRLQRRTGSQSGPGLPSVVINQNFVPPQASPQVRDYSGRPAAAATAGPSPGLKLIPGAASHPYADAAAAQRAASELTSPPFTCWPSAITTIVQALGIGWKAARALRERRAYAHQLSIKFGRSRFVAALE